MFTAKNMNLTFLVKVKEEKVVEAERRIIASFQIQATSTIPVQKEQRGHVMEKHETCRKEIEQQTGARIQIPCVQDTSDIMNITRTIDAIEKAGQEIQIISDELTLVIKGPKDDVDSAIKQIQTMVDEVHSSVLDLKVKPNHKCLIGKNTS